MSSKSFTILLFIQLARRLRQTNARYNHIAYQCRHTRRATHHAKQHAYQAGLCIDTTKARGAYVDNVALSQTADPDMETSTRLLSQASVDEGCMSSSGLTLRNLPEVGVQSGMDADIGPEPYRMPDHVPVPGAPRWTTRALPEEDAPACEAVWRGATALDVDAMEVGDVVPSRLLKRKEAYQRPEVGVVQKRRREL